MTRILLTFAVAALASCSTDSPRGDYGMSGGMDTYATDSAYGQAKVPPMADDRAIDDEDCTKPMKMTGGNLRCR